MTYANENFWNNYLEYIDESFDRHQKIVKSLIKIKQYPYSLLDLGCGQSLEAALLLYPYYYLGVDQHLPKENKHNKFFIKHKGAKFLELNYAHDYKKIVDEANKLTSPPTGFTSLFSTEITQSAVYNRLFYEHLFKDITTLNFGLVSGFYYIDKLNDEVVKEVGGLESYQCIDKLGAFKSSVFKETRVIVEAPSKLFGPNVIEVWKFLERR